MNQLRQQFYSSFDFSYLRQQSLALESLERLGGGRHFNSYKARAGSFHYSISVARADFKRGLWSQREEWAKALGTVSHWDLPLIAPCEVIASEEQLVYFQPLATKKLSSTDFTKELSEIKKALAKANLQQNDFWQIGEAMGVPFVIDWSDLKRIA